MIRNLLLIAVLALGLPVAIPAYADPVGDTTDFMALSDSADMQAEVERRAIELAGQLTAQALANQAVPSALDFLNGGDLTALVGAVGTLASLLFALASLVTNFVSSPAPGSKWAGLYRAIEIAAGIGRKAKERPDLVASLSATIREGIAASSPWERAEAAAKAVQALQALAPAASVQVADLMPASVTEQKLSVDGGL